MSRADPGDDTRHRYRRVVAIAVDVDADVAADVAAGAAARSLKVNP